MNSRLEAQRHLDATCHAMAAVWNGGAAHDAMIRFRDSLLKTPGASDALEEDPIEKRAREQDALRQQNNEPPIVLPAPPPV